MLIGVVAHVSEYFCLSRWDQLALSTYSVGDSAILRFALFCALATRVYYALAQDLCEPQEVARNRLDLKTAFDAEPTHGLRKLVILLAHTNTPAN